MKYIKQFALIVFFLLLGELTNKLTGLPIPGSVFGMALLLLALNFKVVKLEDLKETSELLLSNILLFFIPLGVSLMTTFHLIKGSWWLIITITIVSTFLVMGVTSLIVQLLAKKK